MIVYSRDARHDIVRLRSFLSQSSPGAARRAMAQIFKAIDRLQNFPDRGHITKDANIRQIMIPFGVSGYVVRYAIIPKTNDILITRIWHGREARP